MPISGGGGYQVITGATFDPATLAWVAAVVGDGGTVSATEEGYVDALIVGLKADNLFSKLDRLWLFAVENEFQALRDIVATALATAVNTPTFTANTGYTGEDSATPSKYIDTLYIPNTSGSMTTSSGHVSAWVVGNIASSFGGCIIGVSTTGSDQTTIYDTFTDGNVYVAIAENVVSLGSPASRQGHIVANRANSTGTPGTTGYRNGSSLGATGNAATGLAIDNVFVLAQNHLGTAINGTPNQIAMSSMGAGLSATDITNFYNRLRTYMTAVGVP